MPTSQTQPMLETAVTTFVWTTLGLSGAIAVTTVVLAVVGLT